MTIKELHDKLNELGVNPDKYYLHGLYGSGDDTDKPALAIRRGKYTIEYVIYFKERGQIDEQRPITDETEACEYFLRRIITAKIFENIVSRDELKGRTVNEMLHLIGLMNVFDNSMKGDKILARLILEPLNIGKQNIEDNLK